MLPFMVKGVNRIHPTPIVVERFARVRVHIKSRKIAAGDVDPDAVALFEDVGRWVQSDREGIDRAWRHQLLFLERVTIPAADNAVLKIEVETARVIEAGRVDIEQFGREIRIEPRMRMPKGGP
jgi:hypothetical protein